MTKILFTHTYDEIISLENLLEAWREFLRGKRSRIDVQVFESNLMSNILNLQDDLSRQTYSHGSYEAFIITDPKRRQIHKATVRDRLLHRAMYRQLYPFFDRMFISDSFSCRRKKGTHAAGNQFIRYARKVSNNNTRICWILKCDIRKFFASIDQGILLGILREYIPDQNIMWLLEKVISSFPHGLPLGNLTSQLFANVYMNVFDQFVKHRLKAKYYIRYADDFVLMSCDQDWLEKQIPLIDGFLYTRLRLTLHPDKIILKTLASGVDFLGWVHFSDHRVLRHTTQRRMMRRVVERAGDPATMQSYLGLLSHGNTYKIKTEIS